MNGHSALWKKMRRPTTIAGKRIPDGIVSPCRCSAASHFPKRSVPPGSRKNRPLGLQHSSAVCRTLSTQRLNDNLRGDKSSKRSEGVPPFGLPLFSLAFLV